MASKEMQGLIEMMKVMMEQGGMPRFGGDIQPEILRATIEAAQSHMPLEPGVHFEACKFGEMDAELAIPENARKDAIIVYIHGGGLVCGNALTSRGYSSMLAGESKIPVYAFSYALAPEHPFPAGVNDCFLAYKEILKRHEGLPVFLVGESGGAYLCITTSLMAREAGITMPAGIVPYSPVIDFSGTIDRSRNEKKDITVTPLGLEALARMYCLDKDQLKNPLVSPYFADFSDLPPIMLAWDNDETLAPDSEIVAEKAKKAGVEVSGKGYDSCFHAFAITGRGTPESAEILKDTISFIYAHIN